MGFIRRAFLIAIALLVAAPALASDDLTIQGLLFPGKVEGYKRGEPRDYEPTHPGLGFSVPYRGDGWTFTIYVYDLRLRSIPDDPFSAPVKATFDQARREVLEVQGGKAGITVKVKPEDFLKGPERDKFQCASFAFERRAGNFDSYLCVTAWRGKFVKFRMTVAQQPGNDDEARRFLGAWSKLLWP